MTTPPERGPAAKADLRALAKELGPQVAAFKPDLANFVAGIILGVLAIPAGVAVIVWMVRWVVSRGGRLEWMGSRERDEPGWFLVGLVAAAGLGRF
jgi:hypothetical protein